MARYAAYFIVRKSDAVTQSEKEPEDPIFTRKQLVLLIFPLLVEQLLAITIGLSDTIMVAGAGEAAVSGVSVVDAINVLLIQIFTAMATGGAVVAAQYIGSGNRQGACDSAKQLMYVTAIIALLLMALCLCFPAHRLRRPFGRRDGERGGVFPLYGDFLSVPCDLQRGGRAFSGDGKQPHLHVRVADG